jgi:PhoPQ-activated pathogenicity-related protein
VLLLLVLLAAASPWTLDAKRPRQTALDRYVKTPDPAYKYSIATTQTGPGYTATVLEMTSQNWLTSSDVDRTLWTHWLTIIKPDGPVKHQTALVFITGGANDGKLPKSPNALLADIAVTTQSIVAELRMVPNQPVTFTGETRTRKEDELIAYSWDKFLRTGDERWPARLPMTKSVVRAMDTVTAFMGEPAQGALKVDKFVVSGASKRGWTTWTTAAVDPRVVAIAPMVIDLLNVEPSFVHHWRVYGFWSPAIQDYVDLDIMRWSGSKPYRKLMEIEDPYEYRERLTMPKFIINAAGDQYFVPDSWRYYFDDLPGEKYLRYVPNADHSLKDSDGPQSLGAFYASILTNTARPRFTWSVAKDGTIRVQTQTKPEKVTLWRAENPDARDFRLEKLGPAYKATPLTETKPGEYTVLPSKPSHGWTASFVELRFPSETKYPLVFTTGVAITPDTLPFAAPKREPLPIATTANATPSR